MSRALIAVVLAGCGAAVPPVHGRGGPAWLELTSEHFTMWTDGDVARARELVRQMERVRQVVIGVAFPSMATGGRTLVIAMRDDDELSAFSPTREPRPYAIGARAPLFQPMILLSVFSNRDPGDASLAHELTHVISFAVIHHQPRWLSEGMATYFETLRIDSAGATVDVGVAPENRGQRVRIAHLVPVAQLLGWGKISRDENSQYSTAWALFTFLLNDHPRELVRYMELVHRNAAGSDRSLEDEERIWNEAFPSLPTPAADVALRHWLLVGSHVVRSFNIQARHWPIAERTLSDADVYAMRGMLRVVLAKQPAEGRADLNAALALEPTQVLARLITVILDKKPLSLEDARAVTAAHGADWRAWWLLGLTLVTIQQNPEELMTVRTRLCFLVASNPALLAPPELCDGAPSP